VVNTAKCHQRLFIFCSSRRRHTESTRDWSSDVCSSDLLPAFDHPRPRYDIARGIGHDPTDDPGRRLRLRGEGRLEGEDEGRTEESSRQLLEQGSAARHGVVLRQAREGAELAREQKRRKKAVDDGRGGGRDPYRLPPALPAFD